MSRNIRDGFWHKSMPKSFMGEGVVTGHPTNTSKGLAAVPVVTDFEQSSGVILFPIGPSPGSFSILKKEGIAVAYHNQYSFLIDNPSDVTIDVVLRRYALPTDGATVTTVVGTFAVANATQASPIFSNLSGDVYAEFTNTATPTTASTISYSVVLW
jgi:hypothetical protein